MYKRRMTALLLCALLAFSGGCSLIDVDEDLAQQKDNAKVIIEYKGESITKEAVTRKMKAELSKQQQSLSDIMESESYWPTYRDSAIKQIAIFRLALDKAAELGLDKLTEEETAQLDEKYQTSLDELDSYVSTYAQMAVDANSELNYDEEYAKQLDVYLNSIGYTAATYRAELERELVYEKIKDHYLKDIDVTEEEIRSYYDTNVEVQQQTVETNSALFEMQRSMGLVFYYPEGYMYARHILVNYDSDTQFEAYKAYNAGDMPLYESIVEKGMEAIKPKLDDIITRLEAGESFDVLMEEYNDDSAFDEEPYKSKGYISGPFTQLDIPGYIDVIKELKKEGQYSQPLASQMGAYIIRCERLLEGAMSYEEMREDVYNSMLYTAKESEWAKISQGWLDDAEKDGTLKMYASRY